MKNQLKKNLKNMDTQNLNTTSTLVKDLKLYLLILINGSLCRITCFPTGGRIRLIRTVDISTCLPKETSILYKSPILIYKLLYINIKILNLLYQ